LMISIHLPRCSKTSQSLFLYTLPFDLVTGLVIMPPSLTECHLELARHCFRFNHSDTYYLNKLSTQEITDAVQCSVQEPGEFRRRGRQENESRPSTPVAPMPQIIMMPPHYYQFPPLALHQYLPPPAPLGKLTSPLGPEDPADLRIYIAWFKLREPSHADSIEECVEVLNQERDTLSTLEGISEARITKGGLSASFIARMKASVKT
jgi:hypothetical protein